jgi:hypothetical protein
LLERAQIRSLRVWAVNIVAFLLSRVMPKSSLLGAPRS